MDFHTGNRFFRQLWTPAPGKDPAVDGLGPLFNTDTCEKCHIRDGRGQAPERGELNDVSLLARLSVPAKTQAQKVPLLLMGIWD